MNVEIMTWMQAIKSNKSTQRELIDFKVKNFASVGWRGTSATRWRGTANPFIGLDETLPLACVSYVDGKLAGMSFVIANDLPNYPLDGELPTPYTGDAPVVDAAYPWFAGHFVANEFRRKGVSRMQEAFTVEEARRLYSNGGLPGKDSRLWLCTEREPLDFLLDMYTRSGWKLHRSFMYDGMMRWVMYVDLQD